MANREMRLAINRRVCDSEQRFRVIPVLLPEAKRESLPALLLNTTSVEFRGSIDDSDSVHRLVSGIRGVTPGTEELDARGSPHTTQAEQKGKLLERAQRWPEPLAKQPVKAAGAVARFQDRSNGFFAKTDRKWSTI